MLHHVLLCGCEIAKVAFANFNREGRRAGGLGFGLLHGLRWRRRRGWGCGGARPGQGAEEQAWGILQLRLLLRGVMGVGVILGNVWTDLLLKETCQKNELRIKEKSFHNVFTVKFMITKALKPLLLLHKGKSWMF